MNLAWLVSVPAQNVEQFAQEVEELINKFGAKLVYTLHSSKRLFIEEDRRPRDDRPRREGKRFDYGRDDQ